MRTVYGSNLIPTPFPDDKMDVDAPKVEEVTFTLVINKKGKEKAKASFFFLFFFDHQFITWCSIVVCNRLSTTSSLQLWPQETKTPLIGRETQLKSIEIKEKSK